MKIKWSGKRTLIAVVLLAAVGILYVQGNDQRRESDQGGTPASSSAACRVASTGDGVRVRSGPALDPANVVDEMAAGEESDASTEIQNGFRKLGEGRWVSENFIKPLEGRSC